MIKQKTSATLRGKTLENHLEMTSTLEPPAFVSEKKSFAEYTKDLRRWSRLTSLDKKFQAEMVVYRLEGHPSRIKEKISTQLGDVLEDNEDGIDKLLEFLSNIYEKDSMADAWDKYVAFETFKKKNGEGMSEFIADWENEYYKMEAAGCKLPDIILAFKVLSAAQLKEIDTKLVLTGVDYEKGKEKGTLLHQMKESLKKFKGRGVLGAKEETKPVAAYMTEATEQVLISKGWKPPPQRKRSTSTPPAGGGGERSNYKGRKNGLGADGLPIKCYKCKCECTNRCSCPCVYHLANKCPGGKSFKKGEKSDQTADNAKKDLGLFMKANLPQYSSSEQAFFTNVSEKKELVLVASTMQQCQCFISKEEEEHQVLIDCACPTTVAGMEWVKSFISSLTEQDKKLVQVEASVRIYKFGGGERRNSLCTVQFPCHLANQNVHLKTEVIEADLPLLIGNSTLKKTGAALFFKSSQVEMMGNMVDMKETESGHYSINIQAPKRDCDFKEEVHCLVCDTKGLSLKEVEKLHHYFGHVSVEKLEKLIKNADRLDDETKEHLREVKEKCTSCEKNKRSIPKPAVSLPRTQRFNQVVTLDLKEFKNSSKPEHKYILYIIDMHTRLTVADFIPDKQPATVGRKILSKWVSVFTLMETIHSDRGGEFINKELTEVAEYLNIKQTSTAAASPNQNGINERNHAIVDRMMDKMMDADKSLTPEVALCWSLNAKNSLESYQGFSPFQLVFGQGPRLPSIQTAGPPGLEEVSISKVMAEHINALHNAREAFIACESDRIIKTALKKRVYSQAQEISPGSWIYYKKDKKWEGPVKVTTKDGKLLYAIRAGRLLTINSDNALIAKFEGILIEKKKEEADKIEEAVANIDKSGEVLVGEEASNPELEQAEIEVDAVENTTESSKEVEIQEEPLQMEDDDKDMATDTQTEEENTEKSQLKPKDLKKADIIRFKRAGEDEFSSGELMGRAGKVGGINEHWWNVRDIDSGHIRAEDTRTYSEMEKNQMEIQPREEVTLVVNIPRWRHYENRCVEAKKTELEMFDKHEVYEEVEDVGQDRLGTMWLLKEKIKDGKTIVKARLNIRGDQEDTSDMRKDSPTVRKGNIKIVLMVAAANPDWELGTSDVSNAFLQGVPIERDVFVTPPKERRIPGTIWKLKKTAYGLADASRGFFLSFSGKIQELGCEKSLLDPALFIFFHEGSVKNAENKDPSGLAVTHVDDILHTGNESSDEKVLSPLKKSFKFGSEENVEFKYLGLNISQTSDEIVIDQNHYVEALEVPDIEVGLEVANDEVMNKDGQTEFRSVVGKLTHAGHVSRPDVVFEAKVLSTKFGKATKQDLKISIKKVQKLKSVKSQMVFPNLGEMKDWVIVGHGDAGIKSMPDKISSVGGQVIMIVNKKTNKACVLGWRSRKLKRKVISSLAGEALAMADTVGEIVYTKSILSQIYGKRVEKIPVIIVTDSKNLEEAVKSTSLVDDPWLIPDIAMIKEAIDEGTVTEVRRVSSQEMLANCLTKLRGASAEMLMTVMRLGKYCLPGGW